MTDDELRRIDAMTRLDPPTHFEHQDRSGNAIMIVGWIAIGFLLGMLFLAGVKSCDKKEEVMRMAEVHRH